MHTISNDKKSKRTNIWVCTITSLIWLGMILYWLTPSYQAQEEIAIQYRLTGADGYDPSYLSHLNYGFHYWISYIIYRGYQQFPDLNWYSILLIVSQFLAVTIIIWSINLSCGIRKGSVVVISYLLFIATPLILDLNLTGTSIQVAIAGIVLLFTSINNKLSRTTIFESLFLIVLSGLLRFHTLVLILLVFTPYFLLFHERNKSMKAVLALLSCFILTALLFYIHADHYKNNIYNWEISEQFRNSFFQITNHPIDWKNENLKSTQTLQALRSGIIWDTQLISTQKLKFAFEEAYNPRTNANESNRITFYWLLKNNQALITLTSSTLLIFFFYVRKLMARILPAVFLSMLLLLVLWIWFKLTNEIILGITGCYLIACSLYIMPFLEFRGDRYIMKSFLIGLYLLLLAWGVRLILKKDISNKDKITSWKKIQHEIESNAEKTIILLDNLINIRAYSIWESPREMPLHNVIDRHRIFFSQFEEVKRLKRAIEPGSPFDLRKEFLFAGDSAHLLKSTYNHIYFSEPLSEFKSMRVRCILP